jgi:hypothetical protein
LVDHQVPARPRGHPAFSGGSALSQSRPGSQAYGTTTTLAVRRHPPPFSSTR